MRDQESWRHPSLASTGDAPRVTQNWVPITSQHRIISRSEDAPRHLGGACALPFSRSRCGSARCLGKHAGGAASELALALYSCRRRQFLLSSQLRAENRTFALAYQLALTEFSSVLDRMVAEAAPPDEGIAQLLHMSLANYAAGAIMMPYGRFLRACEEMRYSIDRLCGEFGATMSSRCQQPLTTLSRPGARGVTLLHGRVDPAGETSRSATRAGPVPFSALFGGTCPRGTSTPPSRTAGQVVTQLIETRTAIAFHRGEDHRRADQE